MRVAIHQPNYAPWCGYFAKLLQAEIFVWLDDAQLPLGRSYVSRTRVIGPNGPLWLSVPIRRQREQTIAEVRCAELHWPRHHLATLRAGYARAPFFDEVLAVIEPIYAAFDGLEAGLADFNQRLIEALASYLGIELISRRMVRASSVHLSSRGDERLIELVKAVGGDTYVSGPGGTHYQDPARFAAAGLKLEVRSYEPIPYPQRSVQEFVPGLSILDALFQLGQQARELLVYPDRLARSASASSGC
jgi:hypothetical protein